jgi:hypothetical protein
MTNPETSSDLVKRLRHAGTTATNDDMSEPMSEKRLRHTARIAVIDEAADALEQQATTIERLTADQHRREAEAGISNYPEIPDGCVLVPREPTLEMTEAGWPAAFDTRGPQNVNAVYRAMLAASPSSPASGVRVKADPDSIRIAKQFADMFRSGAQGAGIDCDAAMSLALALDDILSALGEHP